MPKFLRWVTSVGMGAAFVLYPILVYTSLSSRGGRPTTGRLYWLALPLGVWAFAALRPLPGVPRASLTRRALAPGLALILLGGSLALGEVQPLLLVPVVVNGALLATFLPTLWTNRPLIERFARLQHPDLRPEEQSWCRGWTITWCCFFCLNIVVAAALGLSGRVREWTAYNGLFTYLIMGCLFATEYTVRKYRFGRYASHPLDRLLVRLFRARQPNHHDE